jgi:hypothetical protein
MDHDPKQLGQKQNREKLQEATSLPVFLNWLHKQIELMNFTEFKKKSLQLEDNRKKSICKTISTLILRIEANKSIYQHQ